MTGRPQIRTGLLALLVLVVWWAAGTGAATADRVSRLPAGNAVTDGRAILRSALPVQNAPIREIQANLEDIGNQLRAVKRWGAVTRDVEQATAVLTGQEKTILGAVQGQQIPQAQSLFLQLKAALADLRSAADAKDKEATWQARSQALELVGKLEEMMVQSAPFAPPSAYNYLPRLRGRATVEMATAKGDLRIVVDGYSAPLTAGNFVDLVQRGFYDRLTFTRAEESYVLQAGDPPGPAVGFVDPQTGRERTIPLEILVKGDSQPVYGATLEDLGRYRDEPVLPFAAYGAVAMARPGDAPNGASSQFFFFLFEPELTPAGLNLLDGRYAVFGYVTAGKEVLGRLRAGDQITSARVVEGGENLILPAEQVAQA